MSKIAIQISVILLLPSVMLPAYADVTSLRTDRALYSIDMTIFFTGTVDPSDSQKLVNLMIEDPNGKIILMTGNPAGTNGTFQIAVNTNNEKQFSLKGTYSATAFVNSAAQGRTVPFDFSPDGSPIMHNVMGTVHGQAVQLTNGSNPAISPGAKRYNSSFFENVILFDHANFTKSPYLHSAPSKGLSLPGVSVDAYYPLMIVAGAALVGFILFRRRRNLLKGNVAEPRGGDFEDADYAMALLKERLARGEITLEEFKVTKDVLSEP